MTDPDDEAPVSASGKGPTLWKAIAQGCKLQTIQQFWKLGLPGGAMMAADASSFDVTTAFAGALGAPYLIPAQFIKLQQGSRNLWLGHTVSVCVGAIWMVPGLFVSLIMRLPHICHHSSTKPMAGMV